MRRGIGAALARELAAGHDLILSGRNVGRWRPCARRWGTPLVLDLTRPESFEAALAGLGRVSNVVHNAGWWNWARWRSSLTRCGRTPWR